MLVFVALPDPPAIEPAAETEAQGGLGEILRGPALWPLLPLAFVGYAFVIAIRSLWIAPYLGEVHGFDATQRGNAALVMAIAMSLGALAYGPLERALASPKLTTLIGSLLTGACLVALGLLGETSATLAVTLLAVIGAAGLTYAILMAHARLFFPARLLGRGVTFMNFVVHRRRRDRAMVFGPPRPGGPKRRVARRHDLWPTVPRLRRDAHRCGPRLRPGT